MKSNPKILISCPKCQKLVTKTCLSRHLIIHEERQEHRCEICLLVCKNRISVMQHKYESHPKFPRLPHPCQKCGKKFTTKSNMVTHQEHHCPQGMRRRVTCHLCGILVVPYKYNIHIRVCSGTGMKDFPCYFCHKRFSTSKSSQGHFRVHSKEKPHSCKHCPYKSAYDVNVRRHELWIHGKWSKQCLHICYFCDKGYNSQSDLCHHINGYHVKEKGYKCPTCQRGFSTKRLLKSHIKTGVGGQRRIRSNDVHQSLGCFCYFCGQGFKTNKSSSAHMLKYHTKETSIKCKFNLRSDPHDPHFQRLHRMTHANEGKKTVRLINKTKR